MDVSVVRRELGWEPWASSLDALGELLLGIRDGAGGDTPPLGERRRWSPAKRRVPHRRRPAESKINGET